MTKQFDTIVYIGRFQPLHNAHIVMLHKASVLAKQVIVVVGSANQPRTVKNPFTSDERIQLLSESVHRYVSGDGTKFIFEPNEDTVYNNGAWCIRVQNIVAKYTSKTDRIAIIGHKKDETTFYLNMFPQWEFVDQPLVEPLNATQIRDAYFTPELNNINWFKGVVPETTIDFLSRFVQTSDYHKLVKEKEFLVKCKLPYAGLPYEPVFTTADMCVFQSGHVLMGIRKSEPGKGLLAFPGGYLNAATDRSCFDAAIRELYEETRLKVPEKVLRGSIVGEKVFDAIGRSERGRIITHAYKAVLPDGELPKVRGSDDLQFAAWYPISEISRQDCFEDHYDILQYFVNLE
ncbi:MAG: ADP-ribose pyrophosphatase [Bacteroidetes bacterium]|nr:MAG: ADP-ribose pyrophosphatase [Bacteroidota bacterium]